MVVYVLLLVEYLFFPTQSSINFDATASLFFYISKTAFEATG